MPWPSASLSSSDLHLTFPALLQRKLDSRRQKRTRRSSRLRQEWRLAAQEGTKDNNTQREGIYTVPRMTTSFYRTLSNI
ncbi:hypothetical protein PsYK624_138790 [Phanerochaete sordida]|uniref:Uncharacterized protein n=1 Tax=Phanerochaete sordida TaxID=48140 RepID=A0A9P3GMG9_9APHY|nr:hypothetical protein PsYK624_138790 [Phanerochaete sordida]